MSGLLSGVEQQQMQNYRMKNFLLGTGIGLLSQGPSNTPITFGSSLGKGLASGFTASQQAQSDYLQQAQMGIQMNHQKQQEILAQKQDERAGITSDQNAQLFKYNLADAQRQASNRDALFPGQLAEQKMRGQITGFDLTQAQINNANAMAHANWLKTQPQDVQDQFAVDPIAASKHYFNSKYPNADGGDKYFGTPLPITNADGSIGYGLPSKDGSFKTLTTPEGSKFMSPYDKAYEKNKGGMEGDIAGKTTATLPITEYNVANEVKQIDELLKHPALETSLGPIQGRIPTSVLSLYDPKVADFRARVDQIKGGAFLQAYETLKGGGAIANAEGEKASAAKLRAENAVTEEDFITAMKDYKTSVLRGLEAIKKEGQGRVNQNNENQPQPTAPPNENLADPLGIRK